MMFFKVSVYLALRLIRHWFKLVPLIPGCMAGWVVQPLLQDNPSFHPPSVTADQPGHRRRSTAGLSALLPVSPNSAV